MAFTLESKVALVTGAGRGIGQAIAQKLASAGAAVMINDLDDKPAAGTEAVIQQSGGRAARFSGSVTDAAFAGRLVETTLQRFGALDIIVNNAGYTWDNVIQKTTDEQFGHAGCSHRCSVSHSSSSFGLHSRHCQTGDCGRPPYYAQGREYHLHRGN